MGWVYIPRPRQLCKSAFCFQEQQPNSSVPGYAKLAENPTRRLSKAVLCCDAGQMMLLRTPLELQSYPQEARGGPGRPFETPPRPQRHLIPPRAPGIPYIRACRSAVSTSQCRGLRERGCNKLKHGRPSFICHGGTEGIHSCTSPALSASPRPASHDSRCEGSLEAGVARLRAATSAR